VPIIVSALLTKSLYYINGSMRGSRRNKIHPCGNPTIVRSIPAVFLQHSYPHPRETCRFRGIPAVPILVHTSSLTALFLGLSRWANTRKAKTIWILLKQETVSGSGISWAICRSAPRSILITMPTPHHSVFYRQDALIHQPVECGCIN